MAWTTRATRRCSAREPAPAPRGSPSRAPRLPPRERAPHLRVVDRRPDGDRPHGAAAAGDQAVLVDAVDADGRPAAQGAAAQAQGEPPEAQRGADGVLQGERDQSVRLVPAPRRADPDLHRAVLRAEGLREGRHGLGRVGLVHVADRRRARRPPGHRLGRDRPRGHLRALAAPVHRAVGHAEHARLAAPDHADPAGRGGHLRLPVPGPGRPGALLDDDEPLDLRPAAGDAPPDRPPPGRPERSGQVRGEPEEARLADPAEGGRRRG